MACIGTRMLGMRNMQLPAGTGTQNFAAATLVLYMLLNLVLLAIFEKYFESIQYSVARCISID